MFKVIPVVASSFSLLASNNLKYLWSILELRYTQSSPYIQGLQKHYYSMVAVDL